MTIDYYKHDPVSLDLGQKILIVIHLYPIGKLNRRVEEVAVVEEVEEDLSILYIP
jgi:hypothetical protein